MAYQMTVTLTDQEYKILMAEAARRGKQPETLLRDIIQHLQPTPQQQSYQYRYCSGTQRREPE